MNLFIVVLSVVLGCYAIFDNLISYKRGVFKEYRKMAHIFIITKVISRLLLSY